MKIIDDRSAKLKAWATNPVCVRLPSMTGTPQFQPKKFSSHTAMNVWKQAYIEKIARQGGVKWTN